MSFIVYFDELDFVDKSLETVDKTIVIILIIFGGSILFFNNY